MIVLALSSHNKTGCSLQKCGGSLLSGLDMSMGCLHAAALQKNGEVSVGNTG